MTRPPKEHEGEVGPESDPATSEPVPNIATDRAWRRSTVGGGGPGGGGPGGGATVGERISRLEAIFEGFKDIVDSLRHSQNWTLGAIGLVAALLIGFGAYMLNRMDNLADKVDAVPGQINSNMHELTQTLSTAITAAKQQQPQVILVPAPQPQPAQRSPQNAKPPH